MFPCCAWHHLALSRCRRWRCGFRQCPGKGQAGAWEQTVVVSVAQSLSVWVVVGASALTDRGEVKHPGLGDIGVAVVELDLQASGWTVNVHMDGVPISPCPGPEPERHHHWLACPDGLLAQVHHVDL